jgi:anaerobic dimethyl sulfoxide reductase subunit B (iron-sulfur subunit)
MSSFGFYFDGTRCTTCELACKDYKDLDANFAYRKIYDIEGGTWAEGDAASAPADIMCYHLSMSCNHCENPACVHVCPTSAMHKDADTGIVSVDIEKCVGCGYCHMACPYNAPKVDRDKGHSVKCDGCKDRVAEGKRPICVEACPLRALDAGDASDMSQKGDRGSIVPLPDTSYTTPNLYIKATDAMKSATLENTSVANLSEVK